jgi:hypothetical protein
MNGKGDANAMIFGQSEARSVERRPALTGLDPSMLLGALFHSGSLTNSTIFLRFLDDISMIPWLLGKSLGQILDNSTQKKLSIAMITKIRNITPL